MINIIKKIFYKDNEKELYNNKKFEEIRLHNEKMLSKNKTLEERLIESGEKFDKRYEESIKNGNNISNKYIKDEIEIVVTRLDEDNNFTKLKEQIEKNNRNNVFEENIKKRQKKFYKKMKEQGKDFELKIGKYYEKKGYQVIYYGIEKEKNDEGIDFICSNEKHIILIRCKNYSKEKSIDQIKIKAFHSDASIYILKNGLDKNKIVLKYIVPNKKVFHSSAIKIFKDKYYNCRYKII